MREDAYKVLGGNADASPEEIKRAYFRLIRQHTPDRDPEEFQKIRRAYETLRDGEAQVQMEGLHFDYHKLVGVSLVYTKGELEGQQNLLLLEPTGRGISWLVEDGSPEGWAPLSIEENSELLAAP